MRYVIIGSLKLELWTASLLHWSRMQSSEIQSTKQFDLWTALILRITRMSYTSYGTVMHCWWGFTNWLTMECLRYIGNLEVFLCH